MLRRTWQTAMIGLARWRRGEYEFEMLLGVRGEVARDIARQGHRVRLYVPFGRDWWPHAVRRAGESPRTLGCSRGRWLGQPRSAVTLGVSAAPMRSVAARGQAAGDRRRRRGGLHRQAGRRDLL